MTTDRREIKQGFPDTQTEIQTPAKLVFCKTKVVMLTRTPLHAKFGGLGEGKPGAVNVHGGERNTQKCAPQCLWCDT